MKKPTTRQLTVVSSEFATPNMLRVSLYSESLSDMPAECDGDYIKLLFNEQGGTDLSKISEGQKPIMRTFTIRYFDKVNKTIEIDFVKHEAQDEKSCFAIRWAANAKKGDSISIAGPGSINSINPNADWFFMVADMTALPALSAKIKKLPESAKGYAIIQVKSSNDIQSIDAPKNMKIHWLAEQDNLSHHAQSVPWLNGNASVWVACEFDSMRSLRDYFRNVREVEREYIYISSYWKKGVTEDGHKLVKQKDTHK